MTRVRPAVGIDSRHGFEIGLELTVKAKRLGLPIAEIPTIWLERDVGVSNFKVWAWIPKYLYWYRAAAFAGGSPSTKLRRDMAERRGSSEQGSPHRVGRVSSEGYVVEELLDRGYEVSATTSPTRGGGEVL